MTTRPKRKSNTRDRRPPSGRDPASFTSNADNAMPNDTGDTGADTRRSNQLARAESIFARDLLAWWDQFGRKHLPWQSERSAYRVWLSEIMLQQTQVATVIPYFERFVAKYPTVADLARAPLDQVLHLWTGLGYYARARNLHAAARYVTTQHSGDFPQSIDALLALPGVGRSTAGAIAAIAYGMRAAILDGNVKRVLARYFAVAGWPGDAAVQRTLWQVAERLTPELRVDDYTQAIMDVGATVCVRTRPQCPACPLRAGCAAAASGDPNQFPHSRPKRERPTRFVRYLIVQDAAGQVLLEQRPAAGLWGGLYSFPEVADGDSVDGMLAELQLALEPTARQTLATFKHGFTHFDLVIEPHWVRLTSIVGRVAASDHRLWYRQGVDEVGLTRPVTRLLQALQRDLSAAQV